MEIRGTDTHYFDALILLRVHFRRDLRQLASAGYAQSGITAHQATEFNMFLKQYQGTFYTTRNTGAKTTA